MKKILVIDDQRNNLIEIKTILEKSIPNCRVMTSDSGVEGLRIANTEQPDTILLDIVMPKIDGFAVCEKLKAGENTKNIPVILVSAFQKDTDSRIKGLKSGADVFLSKPIDPAELIAQVSSMLRIRKAEKDLRVSEKKYRKIFEKFQDIYFCIDMKGIINEISPSVKQLNGYTRENLIGSSMFSIFKNPSDSIKFIEALKKSESVEDYELSLLEKNGKEKITSVNSHLICDKNNNPIKIEGVLRDITDRKKAEQALHKHALELQERNNELDAFSHTVAHDLKTPLGSILGFAELLNDDYPNMPEYEFKEYTDALADGSKKMQQIIDNLLLLTSVRKAKTRLEELNMGDIVNESIKILSQIIKQNNAEIKLPKEWPDAMGFPPWIEEVWVNYLSNAIKYGGNPPQIEIGADRGNAKNVPKGMVRFWVKDNGQGISDDNIKYLFKKFERLDQAKTQGYGLGLSIVRRIIEKLGGQVGLENDTDSHQDGKGSVFFFTLPVKKNQQQALD